MIKTIKNSWQILFISIFILSSCGKELQISHSNPELKYEGRIEEATDYNNLIWSGSSVEINFKGESIYALMKDENGNNYYNVIIDDDSIHMIRPDTTKSYIELANGLTNGKHKLLLFKRTEWIRGNSSFYGFLIQPKGKLLKASPSKTKKIEFYGNSITAGYAVEDYSGKDSPDSIFTNNYQSYASITARHFNAKYSCICRSGIGIIKSWFPMVMPEMYDLLNPEKTDSKWNFDEFTPNIVVINLLQNDSWLLEKSCDETTIIEGYFSFLNTIRSKYPSAEIICMLGNMDATITGSVWPGYITEAVKKMNDEKTHTLFIPFKETPGHPRIKDQKAMADTLISFIDKTIKW